MEHRVIIQWTETARRQLANLPKKVRRGLLDKAKNLRTCGDPRRAHRALVGPLTDYYRITYGRYRAVYCVQEDELASGDVLVYIRVLFVAVGIRKEHDRHDIYKLAEKMIDLGLIDLVGDAPNDGEGS